MSLIGSGQFALCARLFCAGGENVKGEIIMQYTGHRLVDMAAAY